MIRASAAPVRVLLVDDQALFREAIATLLGVSDEIEVVGEAADGDQALRRTAELAPDVDPTPRPQPLVVPLSDRELEIVACSPTGTATARSRQHCSSPRAR